MCSGHFFTLSMNEICVHIAYTPLGWMRFEGTEEFIQRSTWFDEDEDTVIGGGSKKPAWKADLETQIKEYYSGDRKEFTLPLDLHGTEFQELVWSQLREIPFGTKTTYKELATEFGNPKLSQAVGNAVGANPLLLLVPCHRVLNTNGELSGYAAGVDKKRWLLEHEGALLPNPQLRFEF